MRPYWLYRYQKTVNVVAGQITNFTPYIMRPDGLVYIWNGLLGHSIVDLYSGQTIPLPVPSFTSGAYGGNSSTERCVFLNRNNGRWTYLAFDNPNKIMYAVTSWAGVIKLGTVNINTQLLEINGVGTVNANGDFPQFVNAWIDERHILFRHADNSVQALDIISLNSSGIGPAPTNLYGWQGGNDGYVHAVLIGLSAGPAYPIAGNVGTMPTTQGGALDGVIGSANVTTWNILLPTQAVKIDINAAFGGNPGNGPLGPNPNQAELWENNNKLVGAYIVWNENYISQYPQAFVPYRGQVAVIMRQNASVFTWDIYVPGPASPWERIQFPRLVNFSRPISPIGAWEA